jgi:hypothetical protein
MDVLLALPLARRPTEDSLADLVLVATTIAFFTACLAYVAGCDRL